ncbi:MAG TPA: oxidoreductase [Syntrophomonas sp.]|jgi:Fe-S-cluster-containing dehydrogenase component|nr:oxidoreductase [Syntrophomonas sp.]HCF71601.1 oxidoreductase [Syntrophomonas sp.]
MSEQTCLKGEGKASANSQARAGLERRLKSEETSGYGLLIDYEYCTGCHACEVACMKELDLPLNQYGIKLLEDGPRQLPNSSKWDLNYIPFPTALCNLCENRVADGKMPSCAQHCQAMVITYGPVKELAEKMARKPKMVLFTPK